MTCDRCKVADTCPEKGSSPLILPSKKQVFCRIIGGYGREPLADAVMSEETKKIVERDGPCLTMAEVPKFDEPSGNIYRQITKIFSKPIKHPREKVTFRQNMMYPRSYGGKHPK